jgi:Predicted permeases
VNANNIGLPVSVYVLGDASSSAPVILLQLIVLAPIALTVLDVSTRARLGRADPAAAGAESAHHRVAARRDRGRRAPAIPAPVLAPFQLVGGAAVPVILLSFGMSLHGSRVLAPGRDRRDVLLASSLKLAAMPVIAWLLGQFVWHLHGHRLFVVVVLPRCRARRTSSTTRSATGSRPRSPATPC